MPPIIQPLVYVFNFLWRPQALFQQHAPLAQQPLYTWLAAWLFSIITLIRFFHLSKALLHMMGYIASTPTPLVTYYVLLPIVGLMTHFGFVWAILNPPERAPRLSTLFILALHPLSWQGGAVVSMLTAVVILSAGLGIIIAYSSAVHTLILESKYVNAKSAVLVGIYICIASIGLTWLALAAIAVILAATVVWSMKLPSVVEVLLLEVKLLSIFGLVLWGYIIYLSYASAQDTYTQPRGQAWLSFVLLLFFSMLLIPLLLFMGGSIYMAIDDTALATIGRELIYEPS